jgi:hypothetical protein
MQEEFCDFLCQRRSVFPLRFEQLSPRGCASSAQRTDSSYFVLVFGLVELLIGFTICAASQRSL